MHQNQSQIYLEKAHFIRNNIHPFVEIIGILNNILILFLIEPFAMFRPSRKSPVGLSFTATIYFSLIALNDTAFLFTSMFHWRSWIIDWVHFDPIGLNNLSCKVYQFAYHFLQFNSSWLLVAFTFERFTLIYVSFRNKNKQGNYGRFYSLIKFSRRISYVLAWLFSASFAFNLHILQTAKLENSICVQYPLDGILNTRILSILCAVFIIHLPFGMLIAFNFAICNRILNNDKMVMSKTRTLQKKYKCSRNTAILLMTITFSFIVLLGPITSLNVITFHRPVLFKQPYFLYMRNLFSIFAKINYGMHLYVYLILNKRFRARLKYLLFECWFRKQYSKSQPTNL